MRKIGRVDSTRVAGGSRPLRRRPALLLAQGAATERQPTRKMQPAGRRLWAALRRCRIRGKCFGAPSFAGRGWWWSLRGIVAGRLPARTVCRSRAARKAGRSAKPEPWQWRGEPRVALPWLLIERAACQLSSYAGNRQSSTLARRCVRSWEAQSRSAFRGTATSTRWNLSGEPPNEALNKSSPCLWNILTNKSKSDISESDHGRRP